MDGCAPTRRQARPTSPAACPAERVWSCPTTPPPWAATSRRCAASAGPLRAGPRLRRLATGRSGTGVGAPLVLLVLLLVGGVAALPVVLRPALPADAPPQALAAPAVPPGEVGGLLPATVLQTPAGPLPARDSARPGVLVLVPADCACDQRVAGAVAQAREFTRNVRLVVDGTGPGARTESLRLRRVTSGGAARTATDPSGELAGAYGAAGVTVLAVGRDGVVLDVLADVQEGQRLEARLMVLPDLR